MALQPVPRLGSSPRGEQGWIRMAIEKNQEEEEEEKKKKKRILPLQGILLLLRDDDYSKKKKKKQQQQKRIISCFRRDSTPTGVAPPPQYEQYSEGTNTTES
jgi:hypothetical protein